MAATNMKKAGHYVRRKSLAISASGMVAELVGSNPRTSAEPTPDATERIMMRLDHLEEQMESNNKALEERLMHAISEAHMAHASDENSQRHGHAHGHAHGHGSPSPNPEGGGGKRALVSWNKVLQQKAQSDEPVSKWAIAEQDPELRVMLRDLRMAGGKGERKSMNNLFHHAHRHDESDRPGDVRDDHSSFRARHGLKGRNSRQRRLLRFFCGPVMHPDSRFRSVWNVLLAMLILYCGIIIPLEIAFEEDMIVSMCGLGVDKDTCDTYQFWFYFNLVIDMWFIIDIFVNFRTGYVREGHFVHDDYHAFKNYLTGSFVFDLLGGAIPLPHPSPATPPSRASHPAAHTVPTPIHPIPTHPHSHPDTHPHTQAEVESDGDAQAHIHACPGSFPLNLILDSSSASAETEVAAGGDFGRTNRLLRLLRYEESFATRYQFSLLSACSLSAACSPHTYPATSFRLWAVSKGSASCPRQSERLLPHPCLVFIFLAGCSSSPSSRGCSSWANTWNMWGPS